MHAKGIVEHTPYISIVDINGMETESECTLKWSNGESIRLIRYVDHAELLYVLNEERIKIHLNIDTTMVGYGVRSWLCCPDCERRTSRLYNVGGIFSCRNCHDLTYLTSKRSGNRLRYLALKIRRLQHELGMNTDDVHEAPLFKPKYMHQNTFHRLKTELEIMQLLFIEEWLRIAR